MKKSDWQLLFWLVFLFMVSLSIYGRSIYGNNVLSNTYYQFFSIHSPAFYSQVATYFPFISVESYKLLSPTGFP